MLIRRTIQKVAAGVEDKLSLRMYFRLVFLASAVWVLYFRIRIAVGCKLGTKDRNYHTLGQDAAKQCYSDQTFT